MLAVLAVSIAALVSFAATAQSARAAADGRPPALTAEAVLLLDPEGRTLFAKNPEEERAPASLVKLMTLYLAFEDIEAGRADARRAGRGEPLRVADAEVPDGSSGGRARAAARPARGCGDRVGERRGDRPGRAPGRRRVELRRPDEREGRRSSSFTRRASRTRTACPTRPSEATRATSPSSSSGCCAIIRPRGRCWAGRPSSTADGCYARHIPLFNDPLRRAGAQDRIHPRGGLQPGRVGLARRAAVHHDRARRRAPGPRRSSTPRSS